MSDPLFRHPTRILCAALVLAFAASAYLGYLRRNGMLASDEMAYRFQARVFASGHSTAPAPPGVSPASNIGPPELQFAHHLVTSHGWYGLYPVGWPLTLALGTLCHAGWLMNPLLGALLIWLTWLLAKSSFDSDTAVLAVLFLFPCPFFFINTSGDMSHALAACIVTAALCFIERGLTRRSVPALVAGIVLIGSCLCVRSFTAVAATAAVGAVLLFRLRRDRFWLRLLPAAAAGAALVLALAAAQNRYQTGSYIESAYALYAGKALPEEISFDIPAILAASPHETATSLASTAFNASPFLFLLCALALFRNAVPRGKAALLLSVFAGSVVLYMFDLVLNAWFPGQRMYFEGLPGLAVLAAAAAVALRSRSNMGRLPFLRVLAFLAIVQATQYLLLGQDVRTWIEPSTAFHAVLRQPGCGNCVVFMRSENLSGADALAPRNFNINSPNWPHASHVYLIDPGPERRDAITRQFRRPAWALVVYDGATHLSSVRQVSPLSHP